MLYLPKRSLSITILINDSNTVPVNLAPVGLWLVIEYHLAKARIIAVAVSAVLLLSVFFCCGLPRAWSAACGIENRGHPGQGGSRMAAQSF
jgi:hypothetical protein